MESQRAATEGGNIRRTLQHRQHALPLLGLMLPEARRQALFPTRLAVGCPLASKYAHRGVAHYGLERSKERSRTRGLGSERDVYCNVVWFSTTLTLARARRDTFATTPKVAGHPSGSWPL